MQECLKDPPAAPASGPKKTKAANAWSVAGCTIQVARPMTKSLLERFENPVIKVNIKTGAVLMDRVREFLG